MEGINQIFTERRNKMSKQRLTCKRLTCKQEISIMYEFFSKIVKEVMSSGCCCIEWQGKIMPTQTGASARFFTICPNFYIALKIHSGAVAVYFEIDKKNKDDAGVLTRWQMELFNKISCKYDDIKENLFSPEIISSFGDINAEAKKIAERILSALLDYNKKQNLFERKQGKLFQDVKELI